MALESGSMSFAWFQRRFEVVKVVVDGSREMTQRKPSPQRLRGCSMNAAVSGVKGLVQSQEGRTKETRRSW